MGFWKQGIYYDGGVGNSDSYNRILDELEKLQIEKVDLQKEVELLLQENCELKNTIKDLGYGG